MEKKAEQIYLVVRRNGKILSFLMSGSRAVEIHADDESDESVLQNIYIGRIKNIVKNIGAAFVQIGSDRICYLPLDDIRNPVYTKKGGSPNPQEGDELLVQVVRENIKTKPPAVSTNLTLYGKYALLTTGKKQCSVSSKLDRGEKQRLLGILREYEEQATARAVNKEQAAGGATSEARAAEKIVGKEQAVGGTTSEARAAERIVGKEQMPGGRPDEMRSVQGAARSYGWLLRTNAGGADAKTLEQDFSRLQGEYEELLRKASYRTCGSCLIAKPSPYLKRLSDLYMSEIDRIVTDDAELFRQMQEYLSLNQPEDFEKLRLYEDRLLPLGKLYSLERHLQEALGERVWLKSGGYLVIQPTEALTVIDVNTGKYEGGKKREAAFLKINLEAAAEAARQIRLRNLSGIILIDFINMEEKESNDTLLTHLDAELRRDPVRTVLVDMTKLSLVEITRQKRERPLCEIVGC